MLDLKLFKIREFAGGTISNLLNAIARGGLLLILSLYLQGALLYSPLQAGIELIPFSLAFVAAGPLSGALSDRYGARVFVSAGVIVASLGLFLFSFLPEHASYDELVVAMVLSGVGGGMFVAPNIASVMNSVPPVRRGVASGMLSLLFNVGSLLSVSVIFVTMALSIPQAVLQALFAGLPVKGGVNLEVFSVAMRKVFLLLALINTLAIIPTLIRFRKG
jgi:Sugar phosphate permease